MRREDRAKLHFEILKAKRLTPGNCSRCGRPNPDASTYKNKRGVCRRCKDHTNEWRAQKRLEAKRNITFSSAVLTELFMDLQSRIVRLENSHRKSLKLSLVRYQNGYRTGMKITKETAEMLAEYARLDSQANFGKSIDIQGLRQISHVYEKEA